MKKYIISLLSIVLALNIYAQERNYFDEAEQAFNAGQYKKAELLYNAAYVMKGKNISAKKSICIKCQEYLNKAREGVNRGNTEEAKKWYTDLLKENPKDKEATEYINVLNKPIGIIKPSSPEFDEVQDFNHGYACVRLGRKWGMVNSDFDVVVPVIYDKIWDLWNTPKQTTTAAIKNGQMGFVNMQGIEVTEFKYRAIRGIETDTPNIFFYVYQWNGPEVYIDMNGDEYRSEHDAAYGIKNLRKKTGCSNGPYKVGDYYCENGDNGVVFEVEANGIHGKILCFEQDYSTWTLENNKYQTNLVGAFDEFDGMNNLKRIMLVPNWKYIFPAFSWCNKHGEGWYLPAINELKSINDNLDQIDRGLRESGYRPMKRANYLSSTENSQNSSHIYYIWGMGNNPGEILECSKESSWVVAIKKF